MICYINYYTYNYKTNYNIYKFDDFKRKIIFYNYILVLPI